MKNKLLLLTVLSVIALNVNAQIKKTDQTKEFPAVFLGLWAVDNKTCKAHIKNEKQGIHDPLPTLNISKSSVGYPVSGCSLSKIESGDSVTTVVARLDCTDEEAEEFKKITTFKITNENKLHMKDKDEKEASVYIKCGAAK